jgi:hypothetical protein
VLPPVPTAGELLSGFWDVSPSAVMETYARACGLYEHGAVTQAAAPRVRTLVVRADEMARTFAPDGRALVAYPFTGTDAPWIAPDWPSAGPVWCRGLDYELDTVNGFVQFDVDPLPLGRVRTIWSAGEPVSAATLWYGLSAVPAAPVEPEAGTYVALVGAVAATCGSPATTGVETVVDLFRGSGGWCVITDAAAYRLGPRDVPGVGIDEVLPTGAPVGAAWELTRLGPQTPALSYLTTPAPFLQGATVGGITWYNESVPLVVDSVAGVTRARFRLGAASQADLDAFWARSHVNGLVNGRTLAQALDTRTAPTTQPTPATLPTSVNPLQLVCRELLAGNAYLLIIDPTKFGPTGPTPDAVFAAATAAAGPYCAVFGYATPQPALTRYDPS